MKKLITICAVAAITSAAYALPSDDFDDNSMNTSLWYLYDEYPDNAWLDETNQRLEMRSAGAAEDFIAVYVANGWGLSTTDNFSFKADFHNSVTSGGLYTWAAVTLGLGKGSDLVTIIGNNAIVQASWDRGDEGDEGPYICFNYSYSTNTTEVWSDHGTRDSTGGTLYVSYDAGADELYLSHTGYGEPNASNTILGVLKGEWGADVVSLFLGNSAHNAALDSGDAYLDNFVVDSGTVVPNPADALPSDDFNDNSMNTSLWSLYQERPNAWLDETNERLEVRSTADVNDAASAYLANGWGFSTADDFSFKTDFHNLTSGPLDSFASTTLCLFKNWSNNLIIQADYEPNFNTPSYFYYDIEMAGSTIDEKYKERDSDDGTLYISYDASKDEIYLSDTGYWSAQAWVTIPGLLKGEWGSAAVMPCLAGSAENRALASGDAYLDNFVVDSRTIVQICEYALAGDLNNDCKVDLNDFAIMASNWLIDCDVTPGDPACVPK